MDFWEGFVSRKKYHGGSQGDIRKATSLKELEEHRESMVQVIKKKTDKETTSVAGSAKSGGIKAEAKQESPSLPVKSQ